MPLITSYFSVASLELAAEQCTQGFEEIWHSIWWQKVQDSSQAAAKVQHEQSLAAEQQRQYCLKAKKAEVAEGLQDPKTLCKIKVILQHSLLLLLILCFLQLMKLGSSSAIGSTTVAPSVQDIDLSVLPAKQKCTKCINWYDPMCWAIITKAVQHTGFSSLQAIVHKLQKGSSGTLFKTLDQGTIAHWINKDKTGWKPEVFGRVAQAADVNKACDAPQVVGKSKKPGPPARLVSNVGTYMLLYANIWGLRIPILS